MVGGDSSYVCPASASTSALLGEGDGCALPQRTFRGRGRGRRTRLALNVGDEEKTASQPPLASDVTSPKDSDVSNNKEQDAQRKRPKSGNGRQNGPGGRPLNSYLKILLDEHSVTMMHKMAVTVRDEARCIFEKSEGGESPNAEESDTGKNASEKEVSNGTSEEQRQSNVDVTATPPSDDANAHSNKRKHKQKRRPLSVKPRSRQSLHMTFFFGGEVLCSLPLDELEAWHGQISKRLSSSSFFCVTGSLDLSELEDSTAAYSVRTDLIDMAPPGGITSGGSEKGSTNAKSIIAGEPIPKTATFQNNFILHFRGLSLFPPRRNNLIVALFDASPEMHSLHDDVRDIAVNSTSEGLRSVVQRSKESWTPHVTVANVVGGSKADIKMLSKMLQAGVVMKQGELLVGKDQGENGAVSNADEEAEGTAFFGGRRPGEEIDHRGDGLVSFDARVEGISMGGPVPEQMPLDWNFRFSSATERERELG